MAQPPQPREKDVRDKLALQVQGKCEDCIAAGKIDVLTAQVIYEVKNFREWKAAIGQVLVYQYYYPERTPTIYLFGKATKEHRALIQKHCDALNIRVEWYGASTPAAPAPKPDPQPVDTQGDEPAWYVDYYNDDICPSVDYYNDDIYPSVEEYTSALRSISPSERQKQMLRAHYDAPRHTITATQLARALKYKRSAPANLHYGLFAKRVRQALNWWHLRDIHICIFNTFSHHHGEWHWIMHPELAEALEELGWVKPAH
jgi:hypothetical protein